MIKRRHTGFAIYYSLIAMVALTGISSLAIDYGHAQMVKVQLRRAADAAARYGASGLKYDSSTAISRAVTSASENNADGSSVTATAVTGHWDPTAGQFTANATPMDAVKVTATRNVPMLMAKLLGQSACTVTASAVCTNKSTGPNFIGLNGISAKNNAAMGYSSSQGNPGGVNQNNSFLMGSNAAISFVQNASILGNVILGPSGTFSQSTPSPIRSSTPLSYPATETPPFFSSGNLSVSGTTHISGGGTKVYTNITFSNNATLIFDSPTTVYVTGNVVAGQASVIKPASGAPKDLMIRMTGGASAYFGGNNANNIIVTAQVYAPDVDFTAKNNADLYGSMLFRSISVQNNINVYYDSDSGSVVSGLVSTGISMVQ